MKQFSASDAAFSGFRLLREHPRTFAVWAAILSGLSLLVTVAMISLSGPQLAAMRDWTPDESADPAKVLAMMAALAPIMAASLGYYLLLYAVLLAGLNRIILRPAEAGGLARLRLGPAELRQGAVIVLTSLILLGVYLGVSLVLGVIMGVVATVTGGGEAMVAGLTAVITLVALGAACFVAVRLSLAGALTFAAGQVRVRRSWSLTRGRFWSLVGAYFLALVLAVIVNLLLFVILAAVSVMFGGGLTAAGDMMQPDMSSLAAFFKPAAVIRTLLSGIPAVMTLLIVFGPGPSVYRELYGEGAEPAI